MRNEHFVIQSFSFCVFALILAEKVEQNVKAVDAVSIETTIQTKGRRSINYTEKAE